MKSGLLGLVLGLGIAFGMTSCIVRTIAGSRLTGTCSGACSHYVECKSGHSDGDRSRCQSECPEVFSDRDSLMAYESLSCADAVEYVDGGHAKSANVHR